LQALTTSVAFWYGLEAFKLRAEVVQDEIQVSNTLVEAQQCNEQGNVSLYWLFLIFCLEA